MKIYIRNIICITGVVFLTYGCAMLQGWKTDAQACLADKACFDAATAKAADMKTKITEVSGVVSPLPWVPAVAGSVGGGIALVVYLVLGGKKKKEETPK